MAAAHLHTGLAASARLSERSLCGSTKFCEPGSPQQLRVPLLLRGQLLARKVDRLLLRQLPLVLATATALQQAVHVWEGCCQQLQHAGQRFTACMLWWVLCMPCLLRGWQLVKIPGRHAVSLGGASCAR